MADNRISLAAARGNFMTWCISGALPLGEVCRPLYFAQKLTGVDESEVGEFYPIYSANDARRLFGAGSIAASMAIQHFCTCPELPLYIAPINDPASGTAAVHTIKVLGPATDNGVLSVAILDENFAVGVIVGSTAAQVAQALASVLGQWVDLPFTVALGEDTEADTIKFTAKNKGPLGNWFEPFWNPNFGDVFPPGIGIEVDTPTAGVGVINIDAALPVLNCQFDCIGAGFEDEIAINTLILVVRQNWACNVQGDFKGGHVFHSRTDTSGLIYAYGMDRNNPEECVMPNRPDYKYPGYLLTAAATSRVCCTACVDPSRPVQYDNGGLGCLFDSMKCATIWSNPEKKMFFDAGIVNWDVANSRGVRQTGLEIQEPLTTYKYDPETGAPDGAWQRVESRYTVVKFVRDLGNWYRRNYSSVSLVSDGTTIPQGKRAVNPRILQASILSWLRTTELGWTAELSNVPLEQMVAVQRTNSPNNCDPNRVNVGIDLDLVNQLARIATTIDVSPEFACIPPT